jgi:N-acetyl-S-(2-succino)cysteine monooxygenase
MTAPRQIKLGMFLRPAAHHVAGWRHPDAWADGGLNFARYVEMAQTAERGLFDLMFSADALTGERYDRETLSRTSYVAWIEPMSLLTALAPVTKNIGLVCTSTTTYDEPYHVARRFASLDLISGGRSGWNLVTSANDAESQNFGRESHLPKHERYRRAREFVDVVRGLWDTWDDGAIVADKATGTFVDPSKIRPLDHKGRFFSVKGPLNIERCPQGHPIIIQAGGSVPGQELSARTADLVFSVVQDAGAAKAAYDSLKERVARHGRPPEQVPILPGVMPIIGATEQEAKDKLTLLQSWLTSTNALTLVSQRLGHDISGYPLDGPVPDFPLTNRGQGFSKALFDMARRDNMTLRDLYNLTAAARGHWVLPGTPKRIADTFEEWFTEGRADGFIVMPPYFPAAFDEFVDLVVPELQRRGLFRREYSGPTLRDHLGLARPPARPEVRRAG